jgi:hypothetical protein
MNGGPGCTSLKGGFEELGQLVFNRRSFTENTTLAPKMYYNPVGWTRKSTMLYFESPPGVGFSYCDVCVGNATCNCVATDVSTAEDNYDALVSFFDGFPEFKDNEFFITGESCKYKLPASHPATQPPSTRSNVRSPRCLCCVPPTRLRMHERLCMLCCGRCGAVHPYPDGSDPHEGRDQPEGRSGGKCKPL